MEKTKRKFLFLIDLDGTLLADSSRGYVNETDKKAIEKLKEAGHIVCLVTGRPWKSTKKIYNELGLNTVVANYNGAQIHNPTDYYFTPQIAYMNLNDVMYILGDKKIKKAIKNLAIEGPGWVMIQKKDKYLEKIFGFSKIKKYRVGIDFHKLSLKPTGVIFDLHRGVDALKLKEYLTRRYGDLAEFSTWSKGEGLTPVFDITSVGSTKAKVVRLLARYYNVPINRTVAIGDGYNDIPMLKTAQFSVAIANADEKIKLYSTYITKKTNKAGGVAEFIEKFLADKTGAFKRKMSIIKRKKSNFTLESTQVY